VQKLSRVARAAKAARDLEMANTPRRKKFRAFNQKIRRAAKKVGKWLGGKDYDHHTKSFVSSSNNRGGMGKTGGTKNE